MHDGKPSHGEESGRLNSAIRRLIDFTGYAWTRFISDRCWRMAAGLSYTSLLAVVPLTAIAFSMLAAFPVFGGVRERFQDVVFANFLPQSAEAMRSYFDQFIQNTTTLSAVGIIGLAATAVLLLGTIEADINAIFRIKRPRPLIPRRGQFLIGNLSVHRQRMARPRCAGRAVGLGRATDADCADYCRDERLFHGHPEPLRPPPRGTGWWRCRRYPVRPVTQGFWLVCQHVPDLSERLRRPVGGADFSDLDVSVMERRPAGRGHYHHAGRMAPGGRAPAGNAMGAGRLNDALAVLTTLAEASLTGQVVRRNELLKTTTMVEDRMEGVLEALQSRGFVQLTADDGWVLSRDLSRTTLFDLFDALSLAPRLPRGESAGISQYINAARRGIQQNMDIPLHDVLSQDSKTHDKP